MDRDRDSIHRWFSHQMKDLHRRALKCRQLPLKVWLDHTSPRKIRYLFYVRIFDRHKNLLILTMVALRPMSDGTTVYLTWPVANDSIEPMVYIPHVFKQYALPDRANVKKTGVELIKHFMERNSRGIDSKNQHVVGRSVRYNGEDHLSCCVDEGVLLGHMQGPIYIAKTFITYDMCGDVQMEEFKPKREGIPTDKEIYESERIYRV